MTGKATLAACEWIQAHHPGRPEFILSGNIDTDKKHSQINMLLTRGKRVVAEAVDQERRAPEPDGRRQRRRCSVGRQISQRRSVHRRRGEQRRARGQRADGAVHRHRPGRRQRRRVARRAHLRDQLLDNGDYYWSITLPALIVATYGGGTGLATQRECLEMLGCYGTGKVDKFAEICAAVVLAGEISLTSAILARRLGVEPRPLGRNRP